MECYFFNLTFNMAMTSKTTELQAAIHAANANVNRIQKALNDAIKETVRLQKEMAELEEHEYPICIKQGDNWFREHGRGYTTELARAGVYTIKEGRTTAKTIGAKIKLFNAKTGELCR